ncbi:nucleotidyltransferase domain-containing protein [uncultured Aliiroseovarius sp.]|uniref:nucleotidyltransferase domain-containing protein n=1 Tax=Aliiroseovarius sediminis TaxID=2925839 RepID=UPI00338DAE35
MSSVLAHCYCPTFFQRQTLKRSAVGRSKHPEILQVLLYGSRARGDNRPGSDVDLAIVMRLSLGTDGGYGRWFFWHLGYQEILIYTLATTSILNGMKNVLGLKRFVRRSRVMEYFCMKRWKIDGLLCHVWGRAAPILLGSPGQWK